MTNKEIAKEINELASLMELHDDSEFKVKSYRNAYVAIRRFPGALEEMETDQIIGQRGLGKSTVMKIEELLDYGRIEELENLRSKTPDGVRDMLKVKGLGPKKIKIIWKDMKIETISGLIYACNENRLIEAKGFGLKTQADLLDRLDFFMASQGKFLYSHAEEKGNELIAYLKGVGIQALPCGDLYRRNDIVSSIEMICLCGSSDIEDSDRVEIIEKDDSTMIVLFDGEFEVALKFVEGELFRAQVIQSIPTGSKHEAFLRNTPHEKLPAPELWDNEELDLTTFDDSDLLDFSRIKGVIHAHTTYSDGSHSLKEMAEACRSKGYEYLVVSDHSKSAFYANGLQESRVEAQWREIEKINESFENFRIFKSIESDILYDGSLDYEDDILNGFDLVIASIHSQLKMDQERAMHRLIKAVEHPATRILGHPTGRLLLGRSGYPVDHQKLIDACAANGVVIELNASPYRLDMDWRWIDYAQKKDVKVAVDPDAHHVDGIDDIRFGVYAARKGGLLNSNCLNTLDRVAFEKWL